MLSTVINSIRVFKGLYDLAFSEDQFYVEQRAEFVGGVQHCVEQAREGWHNPSLPTNYVRTPFKIMLGILLFVCCWPCWTVIDWTTSRLILHASGAGSMRKISRTLRRVIQTITQSILGCSIVNKQKS